MMNYFLLFIFNIFVDNFVLIKFLSLCPFIGASKKLETVIGIGFATTFVMTLASTCSWIINKFILIPLDLVYLRTLSFILIIAISVQFAEIIIHKISPILHRILGIFLPLITTNCSVLGVALININQSYNLLQSAIHGFSAALGFFLVMILFFFIRERIEMANVPQAFQGASINLITAGLMSLAFTGFNGLIKF